MKRLLLMGALLLALLANGTGMAEEPKPKELLTNFFEATPKKENEYYRNRLEGDFKGSNVCVADWSAIDENYFFDDHYGKIWEEIQKDNTIKRGASFAFVYCKEGCEEEDDDTCDWTQTTYSRTNEFFLYEKDYNWKLSTSFEEMRNEVSQLLFEEEEKKHCGFFVLIPVTNNPPNPPSTPSTNIRHVTIDDVVYQLERQSNGTWLVLLPYRTDLSKVDMSFTLTPSSAVIKPENGTYDYSDGRAKSFTVSATGYSPRTYDILVTAGDPRSGQRLVSENPNDWELRATRKGDEPFYFTVTAATHSSITSSRLPEYVYVNVTPMYADLGIEIAVPHPGRPVFSVKGAAENRAELEKFSVTHIDFAFPNEPGIWYRQTFDPAMTYGAISNKTIIEEEERSSKSGGGCSAVNAGALAVAAAAAFLSLARKVKA